MSLLYKAATSNKGTLSKLWVRFLLWEETPTEMAKCFLGKRLSVFEGRLRESPTSALSLANNSPFLLGVNTKQLSNQMLDLTKVINELKEVLIQQVTAAQTVPLRPL